MTLPSIRALALSLILAAGAALVARPPAALATTVLKVDVPAMVSVSEVVLRARVLSVVNRDLRKAGDPGLFTDVEVEVLETLHVRPGQDVPERLTMRLLGGVGDDGIALTVPGVPRFTPGEEVVLFLERGKDGLMPCGLQQGVWRVMTGPWGLPVVQQSTEGLLLLEPGVRGAPHHGHSHGLTHRSLADLQGEVRKVSEALAR